MNKYVVDTHVLLWFLEGSKKLGAKARSILADPDSELVVPVIGLAEACWIIERGRSAISSASDFLSAIDADSRITIVSLTRPAVEATLRMTQISEMHDRQIVATALLLQEQGDTVALLTKDENIIASKLVPTVW